MFNVNFRDIAEQITPHFLRKAQWRRILFSAIKPLSTLNNDGVPIFSFGHKNPTLYQFQLFIENFLRFDARTIYLERYLNDQWDPTNRQIKIVNNNTPFVLYLFNKAEQADPVYMYNLWDATISYVVDDRVMFGNIIYKATAPNSNDQPPSANWTSEGDITFLYNFEDETPFDYRIEIPIAVTGQPNYSNERFKNQVRLFNSAGRSFEGVQLGIPTNQFFNSLT